MYEIVAKTEYQDIYRLAYGLLFVVDKFKEKETNPSIRYSYSNKTKRYNKNTQDGLTVAQEDYYDKYYDYYIEKGTVLFHYRPVKLCEPKDYTYKIKTTGDSFSGNMVDFQKLLNEINEIFNRY